MLSAGGIGVTPYASILKQIKYRLHNDKDLKLKKVYFYWINRDEGSFNWFADFLRELETDDPQFFEIHTFMTGGLDVEKVRKIFYQSPEYTKNKQDCEVICRVINAYEPECSDELDLTPDEMIVVTERDPSGWWMGYNQVTKQKGLFPSNYVAVIDQVTGLNDSKHRHYGRPIWSEEFGNVRKYVESVDETPKPKVGVFFCGPPMIAVALKENVFFILILELKRNKTWKSTI